MAKAPHPADAFEADVIANAVTWTAFQMRGPTDRHKTNHDTREEAEEAGRAFVEEHPVRPAMIYAVNAAGRQALAGLIHPKKGA